MFCETKDNVRLWNVQLKFLASLFAGIHNHSPSPFNNGGRPGKEGEKGGEKERGRKGGGGKEGETGEGVSASR